MTQELVSKPFGLYGGGHGRHDAHVRCRDFPLLPTVVLRDADFPLRRDAGRILPIIEDTEAKGLSSTSGRRDRHNPAHGTGIYVGTKSVARQKRCVKHDSRTKLEQEREHEHEQAQAKEQEQKTSN
jgi:hypothetical protein